MKTAFLQTRHAKPYVYVVPPIESADRRRCLWLLLTASIQMVDANAKWKVLSDQILHVIVVLSIPEMTQLLYLKSQCDAVAAARVRIVYDPLLCGEAQVVDNVTEATVNRFTLSTLVLVRESTTLKDRG